MLPSPPYKDDVTSSSPNHLELLPVALLLSAVKQSKQKNKLNTPPPWMLGLSARACTLYLIYPVRRQALLSAAYLSGLSRD